MSERYTRRDILRKTCTLATTIIGGEVLSSCVRVQPVTPESTPTIEVSEITIMQTQNPELPNFSEIPFIGEQIAQNILAGEMQLVNYNLGPRSGIYAWFFHKKVLKNLYSDEEIDVIGQLSNLMTIWDIKSIPQWIIDKQVEKRFPFVVTLIDQQEGDERETIFAGYRTGLLNPPGCPVCDVDMVAQHINKEFGYMIEFTQDPDGLKPQE